MRKRRTLATTEEVPAQFVQLANDRCDAITREWFHREKYGLKTLAASCYLQGAADMAMAIEHRKCASEPIDDEEPRP